jgi:serine/threonine-protein kinase
MSRVFLARETALDRYVVVKVLGSEVTAGLSADRFAREVRLAASLQHPNIVPVLTTGMADGLPYYTMPFVKGESLRARMRELGTLPRRQVISILRDIARALEYAHNEGVIHRDIKPDNVLLAGDAALVTDFGIAKAISVARTSSSDSVKPDGTLTQAGSTVGTPAYMAPEQASGQAVDHRVDLYAWGILAYELLGGDHPFAGKASLVELLAAQLTQAPAPLSEKARDIPVSIADLVMRCLEKDPDDRPANAGELLDGLEFTHESRDRPLPPPKKRRSKKIVPFALGAAVLLVAVAGYSFYARNGKAAKPISRSSVAVLPFANGGADSAEAYFGEGIADELMTALAKVPGLRVASRTSAIALSRRHDLDVREIGRQLGVSAVVEGTVRRSGGQRRVTAQLTNTEDGLTLWSDAYERENKEVFAVQDDITKAIVAALRPEFAGGINTLANKAALGPGTSNTDAYDLYLRGLYLIERRGAGVAQSAKYFQQAIEKDPGFARAYAGLADALEFFPYFAGVASARVEPRVRAAAERSLQLDSSLAEPRVALAMAHWHAYRWNEAEQEFHRAIAADSTSAVAHTQYGRYLLSVGRVNDAIQEFLTARRLDPLAPTSSVWLSHALAYNGDYKNALQEGKRSRELDPNLWNNRTIIVFDMVAAGKFAEARTIVGSTFPPTPFDGMTAWILEKSGDKPRAAMIRKTLDAMSDTTWMVHTARMYAYLATPDTAKALSEMETALTQKELLAQAIPFIDRFYDPVRQSARFAAVVRKAGLDGHGFTGVNGGRPAP